MARIWIRCVCFKYYLELHVDPLLKLSFSHKGSRNYECVYGFDISLEEERNPEPEVEEESSDLQNADFSDGYVENAPFSSVDDEEEAYAKESEKEEEKMIEFSIDWSNLDTLVGILNPGISREAFLMYLVSMEYISFQCLFDCLMLLFFLYFTGKQIGISRLAFIR